MNRLVLPFLLLVLPTFGQDTHENTNDCPAYAQHIPQQTVVESHGDWAMCFPHDKTTHHFRIATNGGAIEVTANDPDDKANTTTIRSHLSHIAMIFSNGDFSTPMFVHDDVPPGCDHDEADEVSYSLHVPGDADWGKRSN